MKQEEEVLFYVLNVISLMAFNLKDRDLLIIIISKNWMTCIQKNIQLKVSHILFFWVGTLTGIQRKGPCLLLVKIQSQSVYSPSLGSWDDYYQHTLDDRIGATDLSKSSFLSTYSSNVISFPWSHSASYMMALILEDKLKSRKIQMLILTIFLQL